MTGPRVEERPSPNHGERLAAPVDILLLHYTGMPDDDQALAWLCDPRSQVSAHYFVHVDGRVLRLVPEHRRAWHAGASRWADTDDVNARSIGIEIANAGHPGALPDYPDAQIDALTALCAGVMGRHPIPPHRVLGHSDVAPGRKLDPGERFPWQRLAAAGIGHWVEPAEIGGGRFLQRGDADSRSGGPVEALQSMLALYGYGVEITGGFDERTADVVAAFQRHFRPARVDGVADRSTIDTLRRLLAALP
ncbi:MAG TPA: N-acetylmuramoyl-L-alanine amidase [Propylenella sp.]